MKRRALKKLSCAFAAIFAALFCLVACGESGNKKKPGTVVPPEDEDPYVTELTITSPPTKTEYKVGQSFDYAGMALRATWSHGETEDLSPTECTRTPNGALQAGVTEIVFTYEGVSCSQPITVIERTLTNVTFDSSAIERIQLSGNTVDLTQIVVNAVYSDSSTEPVSSSQYTLSEGGVVIMNPDVYGVTDGRHVIKAEFDKYSHEFEIIGRFGFSVPLEVKSVPQDYEGGTAGYIESQTVEHQNFLFNPDPLESGNYGNGNTNAVKYIYGIVNGHVLQFYIYMEQAQEVELTVRAASSQLIKTDWDSPTEMGEQQFNKCFDVNKLAIDQETLLPVDGDNSKTPITVPDEVILPGARSAEPDNDIVINFVDFSLGEVALDAGYNIIEFTCTSQYEDFMGMKRGGQFGGLTVSSVYPDEHTCDPVKTEATKADCMHYGRHEYYTCRICSRMYSDEACTNRIYGIDYIKPDDNAHTPNVEEPTCATEKYCTVCGKVLAEKTDHTFDVDLCEHEGEVACKVCGEKVIGGHVITENKTDNGTYAGNGRTIYKTDYVCSRCHKQIGVKIQAEDATLVKYYLNDGTPFTPGMDHAAQIDGGAVFNGAQSGCVVDLHDESETKWRGARMEITVNVEEAGLYTLAIRAQSNNWHGDGGPATVQDLSQTLTYCVNPTDVNDDTAFSYVKGSAAPGSPNIDNRWSQRYLWGITELADVQLNAGENKIVLKMPNKEHIRACNIDWFSIEKKGGIKHPNAQVINNRAAGAVYQAGATGGVIADGFLLETYMRIKLSDAKAAELGYQYEDVIITQAMLDAAGFTTDKPIGKYSAEFTVTKYDETYTATFEYEITA